MSTAALDFVAGFALLLWGLAVARGAALQAAGGLVDQAFAGGASPRTTGVVVGAVAGTLLPASSVVSGLLAPLLERKRLAPDSALLLLVACDMGAAIAVLSLLAAGVGTFQLLALGGLALVLVGRGRIAGQAGRALLGAALVLLSLMQLASASGRLDAPTGAGLLAPLGDDLLLGATAGAALVFLLRSAPAGVLVLAVVASARMLPPEAAVAAVCGVVAGGAVLALPAARDAPALRHVAAAHLGCKLLATVAGLALLASGVASPLPAGADPAWLVGAAYLLVGTAATLASFGLADVATALAARWMGRAQAPSGPGGALPVGGVAVSVALAAATREAVRLADDVERMLRGLLQCVLDHDAQAAAQVRRLEDAVNARYRSMQRQLAAMGRRTMSRVETLRWRELMAFAVALEQVADTVERVLQDVEHDGGAALRALPPEAIAEICGLHALVVQPLRMAVALLLHPDARLAGDLAGAHAAFSDMARGYTAAHLDRVVRGEPAGVAASAAYLDALGDLERMNSQICALGSAFLRLRPGEAAVDRVQVPARRPATPGAIAAYALPAHGARQVRPDSRSLDADT